MEDGGPSATARRVAAHRLGFTRVAADYGDPAADDALAADVGAGLTVPAGRMHDYLAARTAFFDRASARPACSRRPPAHDPIPFRPRTDCVLGPA